MSPMCDKNNTTHVGLLALLLALAAASPALAQSTAAGTASFSGSLVDAVGRALPDKPIALTSAATKASVQGRSDQAGRFAFTGLQAGDYEIQAQVPGFASEYRIRVADGEHLQRDVALQVAAVHETISVTESAPASSPRSRKTAPQQIEVSGCAQSTVGGCIDPPRKVADVRPVFPSDRGGASATVRLEGRIGADGFLTALRIVSPADPPFAQAALRAVEEWLFTPTLLDGVPVETPIEIVVSFR